MPELNGLETPNFGWLNELNELSEPNFGRSMGANGLRGLKGSKEIDKLGLGGLLIPPLKAGLDGVKSPLELENEPEVMSGFVGLKRVVGLEKPPPIIPGFVPGFVMPPRLELNPPPLGLEKPRLGLEKLEDEETEGPIDFIEGSPKFEMLMNGEVKRRDGFQEEIYYDAPYRYLSGVSFCWDK
jgi:hypothetical protein